ncbi:MAG: hypothetical protein MUF54_09780 [Polyangiaceae bacterium]|nr:hypothetical protein [Polyangiaceae bacterium]
MTFDEALRWLDERGGRWTASANASACAVTVTLGTTKVRSQAGELRADHVRSALVSAVLELRGRAAAA